MVLVEDFTILSSPLVVLGQQQEQAKEFLTIMMMRALFQTQLLHRSMRQNPILLLFSFLLCTTGSYQHYESRCRISTSAICEDELEHRMKSAQKNKNPSKLYAFVQMPTYLCRANTNFVSSPSAPDLLAIE